MATVRIPSLKALHALEATARHRSLTKAPDELNVTVAAVSRQLKTLERDFGVRLFRRRGGELQVAGLLEAGLEDLRTGFEQVILGVKKMRKYGTHRPLTIAVEPSFATTWLLRRLPQFSDAHPDINVRLETSLRVVDLTRKRDIDLGIRYGGWRPSATHARRSALAHAVA